MPKLSTRCHHQVHQVHMDMFECMDCGMIFYGADKADHVTRHIMEGIVRNRGRIDPNGYIRAMEQELHHPNTINVDLGSIPQEISAIRVKMDELEKTLSIFSEILKVVVTPKGT